MASEIPMVIKGPPSTDTRALAVAMANEAWRLGHSVYASYANGDTASMLGRRSGAPLVRITEEAGEPV